MTELESLKRVGTEKPRSYYIPFDPDDKPSYSYGIIDRNSSSRFVDLNGTWQIGQGYACDEMIVDEPLNDGIPVPSCVQMHGYDQIQYLNCRYPFPFNPPYVPADNPRWHYRKNFNLNKHAEGKYYLVFEGVDSAFYLFVNGEQVGYSQISHAVSEFDVTRQLIDGNNVIDVFVVKWCASSYLECQDKFRFSGIFRSVYMLIRPYAHITDYKIEANVNGDDGEFVFINESDVDITVTLDKRDMYCQAGASVTLNVPNVNKWTAESPYLYDCSISACGEIIYEKVGFVTSKVTDGIFTVNGKEVKLKGVNRHESNPYTGATVTVEDTARDLQIIKDLGCNAIRTSHYPDIPQFYQLCDVMGIYVMDEADVESHGACCGVDHKAALKNWRKFADDMFWSDGILMRHQTLVERDKNRPCVVIWSLGNESCFGKSFIKGTKYIRARDSRPVHYEGLWYGAKKYYYTDLVDVVSRMYPDYDWIANGYLTDPKEKRSLILCEYSHAMGNSNGDLRDYWHMIYNEPRLMGAFVWEFCDHAVATEQGFKYGGDFGETEHDGNFCVDGLVTPNRRIKSGALEMQAVYNGKTEADKPYPILQDLTPYGKQPSFKLDKKDGKLYLYDGEQPLTATPITVNVMRAYTDNDAYGQAKDVWQKLGVDKCKTVITKSAFTDGVLKIEGAMSANCVEPVLDFTLDVSAHGNELTLELSYKTADHVPYLPRVGLQFAIDAPNAEFTYHGYGPYESYVDRKLCCTYGRFTSTAENNVVPYIMPQETGSHTGTTFLDVKGAFKVTADKPFSFSVLPYSKEELTRKRHDYELQTDGKTYICLDVAMRGLGSNSCGPKLKSDYEIPRAASCKFKLIF